MTTLREAAQQALEALERQHKDRTAYSRAKQSANATCGEFKENTLSALIESGYMQVMGNQTVEAITALRAALAQQEPVQEPVAWLYEEGADSTLHWNKPPLYGTPLHTAPPQRKPLTQEEIDRICASLGFAAISPAEIVRAVERTHGIGEQS